jgi:hypothetical protein
VNGSLTGINSGECYCGEDLSIEEEEASSRGVQTHHHHQGWRVGEPDDDGSINAESDSSEGAMLIQSAPPSIYEVRETTFSHEIWLILQSGTANSRIYPASIDILSVPFAIFACFV